MSALANELAPVEREHATPLRLLPTPRKRLSTLGFSGLIAAISVVGLALVMVTTTSVGAQSRELMELRQESAQLGYDVAALTSQLQHKSSSDSLAIRAANLGMVPNPYPAFLRLSDGTIIGQPQQVTGKELKYAPTQAAPAEPARQPVEGD